MPDAAAVSAYLSALINQPWARSGRHCWRLVREVQRDLFGRDLPLVMTEAPPGIGGIRLKTKLFATHPERAAWQESREPVSGAIALMSRRAGQPDNTEHAGVYLALDGGGVLHTDDPHGVVFDDLFTLRDLRGWSPIFFIPR